MYESNGHSHIFFLSLFKKLSGSGVRARLRVLFDPLHSRRVEMNKLCLTTSVARAARPLASGNSCSAVYRASLPLFARSTTEGYV